MVMMRKRFATTMSASLLVLMLAVQGTSARFCDFYGGDNNKAYSSVSNQAEVDAKYGGCTEIVDNVNIAANYTGRFYLPNVTTIHGGLYSTIIYHASGGYYEYPPALLLTSIEVPDLSNTGYIEIRAAPGLKTISFPSMTVANSSITLIGIEDCYLDFPSLTNTGGLSIAGNMTRMNFPSLTNTERLSIVGTMSMNFPVLANAGRLLVSSNLTGKFDGSVFESDYLLIDRVDQIPLDISFPALRNASNIYLQGNISSLSMPRLSAIWDTQRGFDEDFKIRTYGNPLNISLPSLWDVKALAIAGTIGSLSFPSLLSLDEFELNTSTPLNVTLEPIKTIETFHLYGNVTAVSMTSITKLRYVQIISTASEFYCSSFTSNLQRIMGSDYNKYAVTCEGHPPKSKLPLILGLAIGLGLPVALALAYGLYRLCAKWNHADNSVVKRVDILSEYELGVPPTYATDGPPTYDTSEERRGSDLGAGAASTGGARNVNADGVSERSVEDATSARLADGSSALQEGASARRIV